MYKTIVRTFGLIGLVMVFGQYGLGGTADCYNPYTGVGCQPLTGRVTNSNTGYGINHARLDVINPGCVFEWTSLSPLLSSTFGYYSGEAKGDCTFIVIVSAKGFESQSIVLSPSTSYENIDFALVPN